MNVGVVCFGCIVMGTTVLFLGSRLFLYSAGYGVNRVQVVWSGFSVTLFCFVPAKTVCMYGCMYLLAALVLGVTMEQLGRRVSEWRV